ncbi:baculoviral IAP repeat-containing protein, partial [Klebsiella pneumoniae]|uniref:baculoviral IAP repeat-containing protein n=1 Tax=Klebsiella pneumoniae TaxID=573 RepID=UPI00163D7305
MNTPKLFKMVFPKYKYCSVRLETFKNNPVFKYSNLKAEDLAEAGFFHTGKEDQTICYYCGGGLRNWEEDDSPWEQHAMWFSRCPFLLVSKGQDFVDECCGRKQKNPLTKQRFSTKDELLTPQ